ncbi:MAG: hypothetical protein ISS66_03130 [Desulfobacteraceae bacterium]|nr:hypothetical protein [Desulfobacteraceae bacterium]
MKKISVWVIVFLFATPLAFFQGCAAEKVSIKIEKSLPQSKLAHYNDSFDKLRDDIWDKAALLAEEAQSSNFKAAEMTIENGQLKIVTKTGCFSKGALAPRYAIRGDFDVQVDCHIDFLDRAHDMDQYLCFVVHEVGKDWKDINSAMIGVREIEGPNERVIYSACIQKGVYLHGNKYSIRNFHGSLRIVRIGNKASTYYKREGKTEWKKMETFRFTKNDVGCGFLLQNFIMRRESITARSPVQARFDNFRINAAQEIIEEEI